MTSFSHVYLKIVEDGLVRDGTFHLSGGGGREGGRFVLTSIHPYISVPMYSFERLLSCLQFKQDQINS